MTDLLVKNCLLLQKNSPQDILIKGVKCFCLTFENGKKLKLSNSMGTQDY